MDENSYLNGLLREELLFIVLEELFKYDYKDFLKNLIKKNKDVIKNIIIKSDHFNNTKRSFKMDYEEFFYFLKNEISNNNIKNLIQFTCKKKNNF
jgi:hypothetical protein